MYSIEHVNRRNPAVVCLPPGEIALATGVASMKRAPLMEEYFRAGFGLARWYSQPDLPNFWSLAMKPVYNVLSAVLLAASLLTAAGCAPTPVDTNQMLTDTDVTNKAKAAIYSDPVTKDSSITVNTVKGVVQLTGTVPSDAVKEKAGQLARGVSGAFGLKNDLQVVAPTNASIVIQGQPQIIIQSEPQPK